MVSNVFQEIKSRVNIVDACRMYGVDLNRAGKAVCPFHTENTPSFSVSEKKQIWRCFGCGEGGDVIALVAKLHRCTPLDAAKRLDEDFRLHLFDTHPIKKETKSIWQMRKRSKDEFKQWQDYTYGVLADWRRKLFMEEKDTSYADYLLDSLMEDPKGFYLSYCNLVVPYYDDSFLDFSLPIFEKLIFNTRR